MAYLESNAGIAVAPHIPSPALLHLTIALKALLHMSIWTGYAVNIISKDGSRKVITVRRLFYWTTTRRWKLEMSTGKPQATDRVEKTVFLRHENDRFFSLHQYRDKGFCHSHSKSILLRKTFEKESMDKWFNVKIT